MNVSFFTTPEGDEMAVLPRAEFEALAEAVEHARSVAGFRSGGIPGLSPDETRAFANAPSPLAFWCKHRNMTQGALAAKAGIAQNYLSEIENGRRAGPVELWLKLAHALDLPVEALIEEQ